VPADDRPRNDPTAERFFPKGGFPQPDPHPVPDEDAGPARSWYDTVPPAARAEAPITRPRRPSDAEQPPPASGSVRPSPANSPAGVGGTPAAGDSAADGDAGGVSGPELARAVIDAALAKRRAAATTRGPRRGGSSDGRRARGYSGPGPDSRDPQLLGPMLERLMKARGWEKPKAEAMIFGAWDKVVGPDIAKHSRPVKLDAGVLTVEAESTAWATQLRMLAASLLRNIAGEIGHNIVTKLNIHGPAAPSWSKGLRRVQGRGPRDTYG
jgi:predicted nucleic acid-binding Zn ribbon protein